MAPRENAGAIFVFVVSDSIEYSIAFMESQRTRSVSAGSSVEDTFTLRSFHPTNTLTLLSTFARLPAQAIRAIGECFRVCATLCGKSTSARRTWAFEPAASLRTTEQFRVLCSIFRARDPKHENLSAAATTRYRVLDGAFGRAPKRFSRCAHKAFPEIERPRASRTRTRQFGNDARSSRHQDRAAD